MWWNYLNILEDVVEHIIWWTMFPNIVGKYWKNMQHWKKLWEKNGKDICKKGIVHGYVWLPEGMTMPETVEVLFGGTILENGQSLKYSKVMYINMFQNSLWMSTKKNPYPYWPMEISNCIILQSRESSKLLSSLCTIRIPSTGIGSKLRVGWVHSKCTIGKNPHASFKQFKPDCLWRNHGSWDWSCEPCDHEKWGDAKIPWLPDLQSPTKPQSHASSVFKALKHVIWPKSGKESRENGDVRILNIKIDKPINSFE